MNLNLIVTNLLVIDAVLVGNGVVFSEKHDGCQIVNDDKL